MGQGRMGIGEAEANGNRWGWAGKPRPYGTDGLGARFFLDLGQPLDLGIARKYEGFALGFQAIDPHGHPIEIEAV